MDLDLATAWIRIRDLAKCLDLDPESRNPDPKHRKKWPGSFFTEMLFEVPALRIKCAGNNVLTPCIAQKKNPPVLRVKGVGRGVGRGVGGSVCHPWVL